MTTIRQELETRLATFAAAQSPPLPIAYESQPFQKPQGSFLECFLLSAGTISATVDGTRNRERGTLQVNVWCLSGQGVGKAEQIAQGVVDTFKVIPKIGNVSIEAPGNTGRILLDPSGYIILPITLSYRYESVA